MAEYRKKKGHMLGLFAIFDGHLGYRVPSYLKDNLFNNILEEVSFNFAHLWPLIWFDSFLFDGLAFLSNFELLGE